MKHFSAVAKDERTVFANFSNLVELAGKKILEVGGAIPQSYLINSGVKTWISVDPLYSPNKVIPVCQFEDISLSATQKKSYPKRIFTKSEAAIIDVESENIDYIFSCNAFEHISGLEQSFENFYKILKQGGCLYAHFGPIWSAPDGCHIEAIVVNQKRYDFWTHQLFPYWSHLVFQEEELSAILLTKHTIKLTEAILQQVYHSKWINRLFYEDYLSLIQNERWEILIFNNISHIDYSPQTYSFSHPLLKRLATDNFSKYIEEKYGKMINTSVRDIEILLRKK